MNLTINRVARRATPQMIPQPLPGQLGLVQLDAARPTIFFCNGPQCGQSPTAIRGLLEAGYPPEGILYYRGGLHDWLTLGLPVVPGTDDG